MHIVEVAYEATAFDVQLTRGGTATMVWDLARHYTAAGHRVSIVTPAHGNVAYLQERYQAMQLGATDEHSVALALDPAIWAERAQQSSLEASTTVFFMQREGIDLYFISDAYVDLLSDILYPTNEMQGTDVAFLKPLVFQVDALRFIDRHFDDQACVVQCYEPAYHYLLPPVLAARPDTVVVSTVVVNTRIDDLVYRPQLERTFESFGVAIDLEQFANHERDDTLSRALRDYFRPSYLSRDHSSDYTCYFGMVAAYSDLVDFVSPGQRAYYSTFRGAPFEARYERLGVSSVVKRTANKHFVGGCALPDWWLERSVATVDRADVLGRLGLRPERPTFYHAARLAQNHKGQVELFRAIETVLATDQDVNFVVRCAVASAGHGQTVGDPFFQEVADRFPKNVYLDWQMVAEDVLFEQCASSDFCLFPSKFELDGFLITMAEAMACGAVPIATAQETLSHYRHTTDVRDPEATGFAVPRSFRSNDSALADRLAERIREAAGIYRDDPETYKRLAESSSRLARSFTWRKSAEERLKWFADAREGKTLPYPNELAIEWGWFDELEDDVWQRDAGRIAEAALRRGDVVAFQRCAELTRESARQLFESAYARGDFQNCIRLNGWIGDIQRESVERRCRVIRTESADRVEYVLSCAEAVDLIVAAQLSPGVGSGNRYTLPLRGTDGVFSADLPAGTVGRDLVLLLTLRSGRVTWDCLSPEFVQGAS